MTSFRSILRQNQSSIEGSLEHLHADDVRHRAEALYELIVDIETHIRLLERVRFPRLQQYDGAHERMLPAHHDHHAQEVLLAESQHIPTVSPMFRHKLALLSETWRRHRAFEDEALAHDLNPVLAEEPDATLVELARDERVRAEAEMNQRL